MGIETDGVTGRPADTTGHVRLTLPDGQHPPLGGVCPVSVRWCRFLRKTEASMGATVDILRGNISTYITCDSCGLPILGRVAVDPACAVRDWDRYTHADGCPDDEAPTSADDRRAA